MAAAAILNNKKSPHAGWDRSDLVEIWHSEVVRPLGVSDRYFNFKIQDNGSRHFEKSKN